MINRKSLLLLFSCFLVFSVVLGIASQNAYAFERKRVAVLDFKNGSQVRDHALGSGAADMLVEELVNSGRFDVVERERLQAIMEEQRLGDQGAVDEATAARIGELLGVDYMIVGKITEAGIKSEQVWVITQHKMVVGLSVRLINTSTGSIVAAKSAKAEKKAGASITDAKGKSLYAQDLSAADFTEVTRDAIQKVVQQLVTLRI